MVFSLQEQHMVQMGRKYKEFEEENHKELGKILQITVSLQSNHNLNTGRKKPLDIDNVPILENPESRVSEFSFEKT